MKLADLTTKVWLTCAACGARVDPLEYFGQSPSLDDTYCPECEYRDPEICANCLAYWLQENPGFVFHCQKCAA